MFDCITIHIVLQHLSADTDTNSTVLTHRSRNKPYITLLTLKLRSIILYLFFKYDTLIKPGMCGSVGATFPR